MVLAKNTSDLETKELPKWKKVSEKITLKRFIGDDEVVSKQELMEIWGKSSKTIQRYVKDGMPLYEASLKIFQIFKIKEVTAWRDGSIDKTMSIRTQTPEEVEVDISSNRIGDKGEELDDMQGKLRADRKNADILVELNTIKLEKERGKLVDANDVDKATAEMGASFIGWLVNSRESLSVELEEKTRGEILEILDGHFGKFIRDMEKRLAVEYAPSDISIFEFLHIVNFKIEEFREKIFKFIGIK